MIRTFSSLIALVTLLVAVACAKPAAAPTGSSSAPGAAQTGPIRIGASISLTGKDSRSGKELQNGYKLWEEQANAKGGVLGRQVEFVIYDDQSDPETSAKLYEKLISEDKVDLIIGPYSSPT